MASVPSKVATSSYQNFRWKTWEEDVATLDGTEAIQCFPFLFTEQGQDIERVRKAPVPIQELWDFTTKQQ